jgi:hypothetical protein
MDFLEEVVMFCIGNKIEGLSVVSPTRSLKIYRRWAWHQIEVYLREGLLDEIELVWGGFTWK